MEEKSRGRSTDADPKCSRRGVLIRQAPAAHGRCTCGDVKGLEVSPCGLAQNELVQRQIRHRPTQPLVLFLKLLQPSELRPLHPAIELAPSIKGLLCNADLAHRLGNRRALCLQNFNLPKFLYNLFGLLSFSSHR